MVGAADAVGEDLARDDGPVVGHPEDVRDACHMVGVDFVQQHVQRVEVVKRHRADVDHGASGERAFDPVVS